MEILCAFITHGGTVTGVLVIILTLLVKMWYRSSTHSSTNGKPLPGPTGLPFIGYLPFLGRSTCVTVTKLRQKYGDIFMIPVGMKKFIFLNSYDVIKEALFNQSDRFSGRYSFELMEKSNRSSGILFKDGPVWQEHRRFALRVMKDFGLGRSRSEEIILQEVEDLRDKLEAESGKPQYTKKLFSSSVSNVISALEFGDRSGNDPEFTEFNHRMDRMISNGGFTTLIPFIFPFINNFGWIFAIAEWFMKVWEDMEWCHDYARRKIEKHRRIILDDIVSNSGKVGLIESHNYCDVLIAEQQRRDLLKKPHSFTEWQLIRNIIELFTAGTDTTAVSLCWGWVLLSLHPEVQERLHEELDRVIGQDRLPRMSDRRECHYTNAVLDEIVRMSSILPFALPHRTLEDTTVSGYFIPKNSLIMPNLYAVLHDPQLWPDPDEFRPSRFLNPHDATYQPSEYLIAFGVGKRACLGEVLAKMELFLFLTALMQRFSVRLHKPHPPREELLLGEDGTVRHLCEHQIIFENREDTK